MGFNIEVTIFIADEKSSFSKEDMKVGKHIEYAKSLLEESIQSDPDWFDVGSWGGGEITPEFNRHEDSSESPSVEQTDPDDFEQNSFFAADDDDLGKF